MSRAARLFGLWRIPPRRVVAWTSVAAAPLAIVVTVGTVMSLHFHELLKQSRDQVDHSYQVLDAIDRIFVPMEDAEAAHLAWVITGDAAYLATVRRSVARIGPQVQRLQRLVGDGPQRAAVDALDRSVAGKLSGMGHVIDLRREKGFEAARAELATGPARQQAERVREDLLALSRGERTALKAEHDDARRRERHTVLIGAAVAVASILSRFGIAWLLSHLRRRGKLHLATL